MRLSALVLLPPCVINLPWIQHKYAHAVGFGRKKNNFPLLTQIKGWFAVLIQQSFQ